MNDEKKVFTLEYPIPLKDKRDGKITQVAVLNLSRIKAKHMRLVPKSMMSGETNQVSPSEIMPLIAGISNLPLKCIEELDMADLLKLAEVLGDIMGEFDTPKTGSKSSGSLPTS